MMLSTTSTSFSCSSLLQLLLRTRATTRRRASALALLFFFVLLLFTSFASLTAAWSSSSSSNPTSRRDVLAVAAAATTTITAAVTGVLGTATATAAPAPAVAATPTPASSTPMIRYGNEHDLMQRKAHGTTDRPVQESLRFGVSPTLADRIVSYNRHFAEPSGYFAQPDITFQRALVENADNTKENTNEPVVTTFYDSVSGVPLFRAPVGRTIDEFLQESTVHGWPSFRDQEVVWDNVRVLRNSGETVSISGSHLGHNLPDAAGNRYCINLVSIAGHPAAADP